MMIKFNKTAITEFFLPTGNVFGENVSVDIDGEMAHKLQFEDLKIRRFKDY